jgi:2-hydroxychromene-2-carboxylate isomerase
MPTDHIDFWFSMGSTYSYLSVMRLVELERSSGIPFRWRPFHLLIILDEMKHIPFADKPKKSAYMWRDIERRSAMYGLVARLPAPYPAKQSIIANLPQLDYTSAASPLPRGSILVGGDDLLSSDAQNGLTVT